MKKKVKARELRAERHIVKLQKAQENQQKRKNTEENTVEIKTENTTNTNKNSYKKSTAKMAGVKSTFILENKYIMTSFGQGNSAVLEKEIINKAVQPLQTPENFSAEFKDTHINVIGNRNIHSDILITDKPREDAIHLKSTYENIFFGKTFNDNIHIQLIYNIIDIYKILSIHINNIVFTLNNLTRQNDNRDVIGSLYTFQNYAELNERNKSYYEDLRNMLTPYMSYMLNAFYAYDSANDKYSLREDKDIFNILRVIAICRNNTFHNSFTAQNQNCLFNITSNNNFSEIYEADGLLDKIYKAKVNSVNRNFCTLNQKNIILLYNLFKPADEAERKELVKLLYNFKVRKDNKNLGFSLKTLREKLIANYISVLADNEIPSVNAVRSNLYALIDFVLFRHFSKSEHDIESIVSQLRICKDDEEKESVYLSAASAIWENGVIKSAISSISQLREDDFKNAQKTEINFSWISEVALSKNADDFSKIIYILTLFLDGKEINDLLTTLINKFENIQSLYDVMSELTMPCDFTESFKIFENSKAIAEELRCINSFARMGKNFTLPTREQYKDVISLLGITGDDISEQYITDTFYTNDDNIKKFIKNNVLNSARYLYLVKYCNPQRVRKLAENNTLVVFVLQRIDETQIDRYYKSIGGGDLNASKSQKITYLAEKITGMNFAQFENMPTTAKNNREKEILKALVGLYLTILYHIIKNLVNINSRYTIAESALDRDHYLHFNTKLDYISLTEKFINEKKLNKHACNYLKKNLDNGIYKELNSGKKLYTDYRNTISHLNAISSCAEYAGDIKEVTSYFSLYHYIIQRYLYSKLKSDDADNTRINTCLSDTVNACFVQMMAHNSYSKDLLKILNAPFGYNLSRYKNLSIEELFDKNK